MKRLIGGLLLVAFLLCSCGKNAELGGSDTIDDNGNVTATDLDNESEIRESDIVGTYVGLHGSGITFLSNGTAEYFWKEWIDVETDDKWSFDGERLTLHSNNLGYDIFADVSNANIASLSFQSDNQEWEDEIFVRVSDEGNSKDVDSYVSLIEEQLHTTLERPSDTIEVQTTGYKLNIPRKYTMEEGTGTKYFESADGNAVMYIFEVPMDADTLERANQNLSTVESRADEKFEELMIEIFGNDVFTSSEIIKDDAKPGMGVGKTWHYIIPTEGNESVRIYNSWALNTSSGGMFLAIMVDGDQSFKNSDDFINMINSATAENESDGTVTSDDKQIPDSGPDGVSSDLKEYLDSYEAFIDEYVEFMKKYQKNPTDLQLLGDYANMLQEYADFADAIDKYDTSKMSTADYKYYIEVTSRCTQKLLSITSE